MTAQQLIGVLTTWATIGRPVGGDYEYLIYEVGSPGWRYNPNQQSAPRCVNSRGHDAKGATLTHDESTPQACACGCGEHAAKGRRFIRFHHLRDIPRERKGPDYEIDPDTGCWQWLKSRRAHGYGQVNVGGAILAAHRVYYERHIGPIPAGAQLDHLCRNRACVNPAHLEPVTCAENIRRGDSAKLDQTQARAIKARLAAGETKASLARGYGVSFNAIRSIEIGRTWKDA